MLSECRPQKKEKKNWCQRPSIGGNVNHIKNVTSIIRIHAHAKHTHKKHTRTMLSISPAAHQHPAAQALAFKCVSHTYTRTHARTDVDIINLCALAFVDFTSILIDPKLPVHALASPPRRPIVHIDKSAHSHTPKRAHAGASSSV